MFDIFKSRWTRAVEGVADFIPKMLGPYGKIPACTMRDPYCLGFLQIVGMHVASQSLEKGSGMEKAKLVFEEALKQFAPHHASEASELLPFLHADEFYLGGKKDGDLYMGWKLLHLAPQRDGEAALERFFDRIRYIDALSTAPPELTIKPKQASPSTHAETKAKSPTMNTGYWQVAGGGHEFTISRTYALSGLSPVETTATLKIICTIKSSPEVNWVCSDLRFNFKPFRLPHERAIVLGLFTKEPKGALVEVQAFPVLEGSSDASLDVVMLVHRDDVTKLLRALTSGEELTFVLMNPAASNEKPFVKDPPEFLARLTLPNDQKFKKFYEETCEQVAHCQDATRARQLAEGWYRRRTPGRDA